MNNLERIEMINDDKQERREISDLFRSQIYLKCSVERIEAIRNSILKNGICRPMMEAVDPRGELVVAGICGAYEELSNVPIHDDISISVVEKLNGYISTTNGSVEGIISKTIERVKSLFKGKRAKLAESERDLRNATDSIKSISVDTEKFEEKAVFSYSKNDFGLIGNCLKKIWGSIDLSEVASFAKEIEHHFSAHSISKSDFETMEERFLSYYKKQQSGFDDNIRKYLGFSMRDEISTDKVALKSEAPSISTKERNSSTKTLGWNPGDISEAIEIAQHVDETFSKHINMAWPMVELLTDDILSMKKNGDEDHDRFYMFTDHANCFISFHYMVSIDTQGYCYGIVSSALNLAKVAVKSKK